MSIEVQLSKLIPIPKLPDLTIWPCPLTNTHAQVLIMKLTSFKYSSLLVCLEVFMFMSRMVISLSFRPSALRLVPRLYV